MILPRVLLQGCCLSCLWGGGCYPGVSGDDRGVCDPRAPWYPLEEGTCRSRVSGTHIASGHALLCGRCIYRGVCRGPGIGTVCACSRGSVYTEILGALDCPIVPTADVRVVTVRSVRAEDKAGHGVSSLRSWGKKALSRGASQPVRCLPFADAVVTHTEEQSYCQILYFSFF